VAEAVYSQLYADWLAIQTGVPQTSAGMWYEIHCLALMRKGIDIFALRTASGKRVSFENFDHLDGIELYDVPYEALHAYIPTNPFYPHFDCITYSNNELVFLNFCGQKHADVINQFCYRKDVADFVTRVWTQQTKIYFGWCSSTTAKGATIHVNLGEVRRSAQLQSSVPLCIQAPKGPLTPQRQLSVSQHPISEIMISVPLRGIEEYIQTMAAQQIRL